MLTTDIRQQFADLYKAGKFVRDKTGVKLLEIAPANFIADDNHIFGKPNDEYIKREISWYCTQQPNINDFPGQAPALWKRVAGPNGYVNSNYGWCIFHTNNDNQYDNTRLELERNWSSRRAIMIYTKPHMHYIYNKNGADDFICTNAVQYMIRDDKLHAYVTMRSNDAWAGYRNDYAWQRWVHEHLAGDLQISMGTMHWYATSLHIYEKQFPLVEKFIETGEHND